MKKVAKTFKETKRPMPKTSKPTPAKNGMPKHTTFAGKGKK